MHETCRSPWIAGQYRQRRSLFQYIYGMGARYERCALPNFWLDSRHTFPQKKLHLLAEEGGSLLWTQGP